MSTIAEVLQVIGGSAARATVLLVGAALIVWFMRRGNAALRHAVWCAALGGTLLVPVAMQLLPSLDVQSPAWVPAAGSAGDADLAASPRSTGMDDVVANDEAAHGPSIERVPQLDEANRAGAVRDAGIAVRWDYVALGVWAAGALAGLAWMVAGLIGIVLLRRRSRVVTDDSWLALFQESRRQLGIAREVELRRSGTSSMPMTFGLRRPVVLLPADADEWVESRRRVVLLHELAHVQRYDCATQAVGQAAAALYWFNPLVWYAARRMRIEREQACDDAVISLGERASEYASHLLGIAQSFRATGPLAAAAVAMARPSQLEDRLLAILSPDRKRERLTRRIWSAILVALMLFLLPVAAIRAAQQSAIPEFDARGFKQDVTVIRHPQPTLPFAERVAWASTESDRRGDDVYWLGYQIHRMAPNRETILGGSHGTNFDALSAEPFGRVVYGQGWQSEDPSDIALLLLFDGHTLARVSYVSLTFGTDLMRRPVYWIGPATDAPSIALLQQLEASGRTTAEVRGGVYEAIGLHSSTNLVLPILRAAIDGDQASEVRADAAEALGMHAHEDALELLLRVALRDRSEHVRREAAEAMGEVQLPQAVTALGVVIRQADAVSVRLEAVEALGEQPATRALPLLERIAREDSIASVRVEAIETIGDIEGAESFEVLERMVKEHPDPWVRRQAVESLEASNDRRVVALLESAAFNDAGSDVQREALDVLADLSTPAALDVMRRIAREHPSTQLRAEALDELAQAEGNEESESETTTDTDEAYDSDESQEAESGITGELIPLDPATIRLARLRALEPLSTRDSLLIRKLRSQLDHVPQHSSDLVRDRATWALAQVKDGWLVEPLIERLEDPDWRVRAYAAWALAAAPDARAAEPLQAALRDEHFRVRMHAVYGVGALHDPASIAALAAAGRDPHWQVRIGVVEALEGVRQPQADATVRALTNDAHPLVREAARAAAARE